MNSSRQKICFHCSGTGIKPVRGIQWKQHDEEPCLSCEGKGYVEQPKEQPDGKTIPSS